MLASLFRVINSKGGAEKVLCNMANTFVERGFDVTILFCQKEQGALGFCLNKTVRLINAYRSPNFFQRGICRRLRCLSFNEQKRRRKRRLFSDKMIARSFKLSTDELPRVDLWVAFSPEVTYVLKWLLKVDEPLVTMFHVDPQTLEMSNRFHFRVAVDKSDVIQVLRPEFKQYVEHRYPQAKVVCIPNVVPTFYEKAELSSKKIIGVGRVCPQKRIDFLINAFVWLKDRYPDWECEWWGETEEDPEYYGQLIQLIRNNHLENQIRFCGVTNDVPDKLLQASIFVCPSKYEGFGLALTEAMAMGLPPIGCLDCPAVNSLIKSGSNGILTNATSEEFASGLANLIESKNLRCKLGRQAAEDMKSFSGDSIWGDWERLIYNLVNGCLS